MKKLLFLIWLLPAACMAQTDSIQVKQPHDIYCRIFVPNRSSKAGSYLGFDFGHQMTSDMSDDQFRMLAAKLKTFDNDIDAVNFMATQGWEVIDYSVSPERPDAYLLRKRISR